MTQEERKITSINKMLDSAEQYIAENGIGNIDIIEISKMSGLTKGAFYHHFKSKQHMLLELLNRWVIKVSSSVEFSQYKDINTIDLILNIIDSITPAFESSSNQLPIFIKLYAEAINDRNLRKYVLKSYNSFISFFTDVLKNGMDKGFIKEGNPEKVSKILFSITMGLLIQGLIKPEGENWVDMAKESVKLLLT